MKTKELDYRKVLKKAIKKGFTKRSIFTKLGISKPTFDTRLVDGNFNAKQKKMIEELYL